MDKDVHAKIPLSGLGDKNTHEFNGKGCDYDHIAKELGFGAFFFFFFNLLCAWEHVEVR